MSATKTKTPYDLIEFLPNQTAVPDLYKRSAKRAISLALQNGWTVRPARFYGSLERKAKGQYGVDVLVFTHPDEESLQQAVTNTKWGGAVYTFLVVQYGSDGTFYNTLLVTGFGWRGYGSGVGLTHYYGVVASDWFDGWSRPSLDGAKKVETALQSPTLVTERAAAEERRQAQRAAGRDLADKAKDAYFAGAGREYDRLRKEVQQMADAKLVTTISIDKTQSVDLLVRKAEEAAVSFSMARIARGVLAREGQPKRWESEGVPMMVDGKIPVVSLEEAVNEVLRSSGWQAVQSYLRNPQSKDYWVEANAYSAFARLTDGWRFR